MRDEAGVSKGFGFVSYAFPDEGTKAVTAMHLKLFNNKPLYVGLAEKRDNRLARLQQRFRMAMRPNGTNMMFNPHVVHPQQQMFYPGQQMAGVYPTRPMGTQFGMPWKRPYNLGPPVTPSMGTTPSYPYHMNVSPTVPSSGAPMRSVRPPRMGGFANGQPNFKFTPQARNRDYPQLPNQSIAPPMTGQIHQPGTSAMLLQQQQQTAHPEVALSAQTLAAAHPQMQKQMLGERLFPLVAKLQPELAGKITGMMLEMDNGELLSLLDSESQLHAKVEEAVGVLHRHKAIPPPTTQPPPSSSAFVRLGA